MGFSTRLKPNFVLMEGIYKTSGLYSSENEHDSCGIGFVANIKGIKTHEIVSRGLEILVNMAHRGAESADNASGDGAGIMIQIPHEFFLSENNLPSPGRYGAGFLFLPPDAGDRKRCEGIFSNIVKNEQLEIAGIRDVPVNTDILGEIAASTEPFMRQVFITGDFEQDDLERKLYVVRKLSENQVRNSDIAQKGYFYIPSLSTRVLIYKGMFQPAQLGAYYPDLNDRHFKSAIALVHSRFSTNTFPTWDLAQPFRYLAHNGEINTIKGNRLWMQARESLMKTDLLGSDLKKLFPVIEPGKSDSASLDNALEFLIQTGRSMHHALSMLVPESFNDKNPIPQSLKDYYEYHSTIMEPWDGPASLLFSDGRYVGGTLDRNGLRPSRYLITVDDMIIMGSETGVQTFPDSQIREKGRLKPGKILLVDTKIGAIITDEELKSQLSRMNPYGNWLKDNRLELGDIHINENHTERCEELQAWMCAYGYSKEDLYQIIRPMCQEGYEPVGSMGNDTPPAVLSDKPQRLFSYFRQQFAQVTNPPIDPIREGLVMSLTNYIGSLDKNILSESSSICRLVKLKSPVLTNMDLRKLKSLQKTGFSHVILDTLFEANGGSKALEEALERLCGEAEKAVDNRVNFIILSDRGMGANKAPIPSLLAVSAVHHHLIRARKRMQTGLIVESAEPREIMHFALLLGYGSSAINPYLSFAVIDHLKNKGEIGSDYIKARDNYIKTVDNGLLKIMSKMGISTLRSYHGAQIFECLGISSDITERYFCGTASNIGGIGLDEIAEEILIPHRMAFTSTITDTIYPVANHGHYSYSIKGEHHAWNPMTVSLLQWSTKTGNYQKFKEFSALVNAENQKPSLLRGFLGYKKNPIKIEEVEPEESILKRFVTGAMSYGSISKEAHEALAMAMNRIGGRSNTGEGGEDPERYTSPANGVDKRSAIKQVASGRFGVTAGYLMSADEIQIKIAQGAKPGEGGQLPGYKVNDVIGKLRNSTPGITLISPPPHHDIYSIEDLAQLIFDLKCVNPGAAISVKLVSESGVGTIAAGVAKAKADLITISGGEGGTGASPVSSIKHAGLPVELGISETHQTLVINNLRGRVRLQTDGQLKTGHDVVLMGLLGAEEFGFSTSALIVLGCVMMRKCHINTCPVGVATQDENLRRRFLGKADYLVNYFRFVAREVREILAELGFRKFDEIVGRTDLLSRREGIDHWKARKVDISGIIHYPAESSQNPLIFSEPQKHKIDNILDIELIKLSSKAIKKGEKVWISKKIKNTDRSTGAMLSGTIMKKTRFRGMNADTINAKFYGSAGQSFGSFLCRGITFYLEGDTNDYLGKGLSGGRIVVTPPQRSGFDPEDNIITGNTTLFGATGGELYVRGIAGERFAVRNSGATTVVEGVGDHGCEYMTGGKVIILGNTGRNFAAGMSGGIAYVLDLNGNFNYFCNKGLVELESLNDNEDIKEVQRLIDKHLHYTSSRLAEKILVNWDSYMPCFVKVIPFEYKKILQENKLEKLRMKLEKTEDTPQHQY